VEKKIDEGAFGKTDLRGVAGVGVWAHPHELRGVWQGRL
jgi:hypothetical protein